MNKKTPIYRQWTFWALLVVISFLFISMSQKKPDKQSLVSASVTQQPTAEHTSTQTIQPTATPAITVAPTPTPIPTHVPTPSPSPASGEFTIVDPKIIKGDYGIRNVEGTLKNNTDTQYSIVTISISLYDDSGSQVGSTAAVVQNFDAKGTWKFKAIILEATATNYKIKSIDAY